MFFQTDYYADREERLQGFLREQCRILEEAGRVDLIAPGLRDAWVKASGEAKEGLKEKQAAAPAARTEILKLQARLKAIGVEMSAIVVPKDEEPEWNGPGPTVRKRALLLEEERRLKERIGQLKGMLPSKKAAAPKVEF